VFEPDGSANVVLAGAAQIVNVRPNGRTRVVATLPAPADGGVNIPVTGFSLTTGLGRTHDGTLYVAYVAGTDDLTGVWRIRPGGQPERVAALPKDGFPNGLGIDERTGQIYVADSPLGVIWQVPLRGGEPTEWLRDQALTRRELLGANGLEVRGGAV
jgi:sugar lactone lactonase YvrE